MEDNTGHSRNGSVLFGKDLFHGGRQSLDFQQPTLWQASVCTSGEATCKREGNGSDGCPHILHVVFRQQLHTQGFGFQLSCSLPCCGIRQLCLFAHL